VAFTGCAGGLAGVGLIAVFAVGLAFLDDTCRSGAFFAGFLLTALIFLTLLVFVRAAALVTRVAFAFGFLSRRHLSLPIGVTLAGTRVAAQGYLI
jgi:hypothetical protein